MTVAKGGHVWGWTHCWGCRTTRRSTYSRCCRVLPQTVCGEGERQGSPPRDATDAETVVGRCSVSPSSRWASLVMACRVRYVSDRQIPDVHVIIEPKYNMPVSTLGMAARETASAGGESGQSTKFITWGSPATHD